MTTNIPTNWPAGGCRLPSITVKFRAETLADVMCALRTLPEDVFLYEYILEFTLQCEPTVTVTLGNDSTHEECITLEEARLWLEGIIDGHVMFETLALLKDYTGRRTFGGRS